MRSHTRTGDFTPRPRTAPGGPAVSVRGGSLPCAREQGPPPPADPSDILQDDWVERVLPRGLHPYARLARLDRPTGTWLLLFPAWWGIALAADGWPNLRLLALFAAGAVAMRGAGCTVNDLADRHYDAEVARTRLRPLPSGAISVRQALVFLALQGILGAAVLFCLNSASILLGLGVIALIIIYPLTKRITYWPQLFLGLAFNWGALLGWAAVSGRLGWPAALLYLGGIFWTLGYDTIYAHQDKEDDRRIGLKSSALALGRQTRPWLFIFYAAAAIAWAAAGVAAGLAPPFWLGLALASGHLAWQAACVDIDAPADCLAKFRSNRIVGWIVFAGIVGGRLL